MPVSQIIGMKYRSSDRVPLARATIVQDVDQAYWPEEMYEDEYSAERMVGGELQTVQPECVELSMREFSRLLAAARAEEKGPGDGSASA